MNRRTKRLHAENPLQFPRKNKRPRVRCAERSIQKPATLASGSCKNNIILAKGSAFLFYRNIKLERAKRIVVGILLR